MRQHVCVCNKVSVKGWESIGVAVCEGGRNTVCVRVEEQDCMCEDESIQVSARVGELHPTRTYIGDSAEAQ